MTLPDRWQSRQGATVVVKVTRDDSKQPIDIPVTLRKVDWVERPLSRGNPMPFAAMGVTYQVLNRIQSVESGSPAAEAGVKPGDVVTYAELSPPDKLPKGADEIGLDSTVKYEFDEQNRNWPSFYWVLQTSLPGSQVKLTLEDKKTVTLTPVASKDRFNPDRGFLLDARQVKVVAHSFGEALSLGRQQTIESATLVYSILRKLGTQISPRQLSGPVDIFPDRHVRRARGRAQAAVVPHHAQRQPGGHQFPAHPRPRWRTYGVPGVGRNRGQAGERTRAGGPYLCRTDLHPQPDDFRSGPRFPIDSASVV